MSLRAKLIVVILLLLVGIGILIYPTLSDYINSLDGSFAIQDLENQIAQVADSELAEHRRRAEDYNSALAAGDAAPEGYSGILDFGGGLMCYIRIPKISVDLPVYHGVSEETLAKGVGHLPGSAFPIGGMGNHAVLTGHTGLPSAQLFTDLTELAEGDLFYIYILGETLAYEVDQILVVLPSEGEGLAPVPGEDHCTLVTCTPYGINSHRLLVRGIRVELEQSGEISNHQDIAPVEAKMPPSLIVAAAAAGLLLVCLILVIFRRSL